MIRNALFALLFLMMVLKPNYFNLARDEKTKAAVSKIMRICGIVGLVAVVGMTIFQAVGIV